LERSSEQFSAIQEELGNDSEARNEMIELSQEQQEELRHHLAAAMAEQRAHMEERRESMHEVMEQRRAEMEQRREEMHQNMQERHQEMEEQMEQLREAAHTEHERAMMQHDANWGWHSEVRDELIRDGIIREDEDLNISYKNNKLRVNGEQLKGESLKKYKKLLNGNSRRINDGSTFEMHIDRG